MLWTHKNTQCCATTRHVVSCDWWMFDGEPCGDTLLPFITHHVTNQYITKS